MNTDPIYIDRMNRLADLIEGVDTRFDYSTWYGESGLDDNLDLIRNDPGPVMLLDRCDTVGCVGGWAIAMGIADGVFDAADFALGVEGSQTSKYERLLVEVQAQHFLGLSGAEADSLFIGHAMAGLDWYETNLEAMANATAIDAAKVLRGVTSGEYNLTDLRTISLTKDYPPCMCEDCVAARDNDDD